MTEPIRTAFLCSGGDSPGMNACLRAFVRLGLNRYGGITLGVKDGYRGLVRTCRRIGEGELTWDALPSQLDQVRGCDGLRRRECDLVWMDHESVSGIMGRGGIVLGSARCPEFRDEGVRSEVIGLLERLGVQALVVCGGDGSFAGAHCLSRESGGRIQVIGVPATIDNDIATTDLALGVDTALNTIVWAARKFNDTADSHHRVMVLEIMGRDCGYLAQTAGLACGAEIVVIPERPPLDGGKREGIAHRIQELFEAGRRHAIVLVAEGVHVAADERSQPTATLTQHLVEYFKQQAAPLGEIEVRSSVLGHMQRGGPPSAGDCILAARFAEAAWEHICQKGRPIGTLGLTGSRIELFPFGVSRRHARLDDYQLQKDVSDRRTEARRQRVATS